MAKKELKYKNLLIVESPAKAKTINKYLGKDFKVMASVGHVIDLPKSKLGVDVENNYEPLFETIYGKAKILKDIKKAISTGSVYLAMDPDREGEAIAWHINSALKLKNAKRVTFNEITQEAVLEAISKPGKVNENLFEAQKARRVLDRLVGYKVSELLWKKIWYGLSAGRVQSAALRLVVEKEEEREAFKEVEYWDFFVDTEKEEEKLRIKLNKKEGKKYIPANSKEVEQLEKELGDSKYEVMDISVKSQSKHPYPPYTTSTLQQSAYNVLGFTAKRTMGLAQALYQAGHITYMRTDSVNLGSKAVSQIRDVIQNKFGNKYLPSSANYYKNKSKSAQEAHEAIRPTDFTATKDTIKEKLGEAESRLYDLIWKRAVASQMANKEVENMTVYFEPKNLPKGKYTFSVGAQKVLFDGFRALYPTTNKDEEILQEISNIKMGDIFKKINFVKDQKFTQPPARYTEATLVKKLELLGIGRPSTYATIISTIQARDYVTKENKALVPTDIGRVVTHFLKDNFKQLVDYEYTANVENKLDEIAEGKIKYVPFLDTEYKPLIQNIENALNNVNKEDVVILGDSDEKCPDCGGEMSIRLGRYGKFLSCKKFPECKGMKDLSGGEENLDYEKYFKPEKCPECGARLTLKNGKYGKFWACEKYPECKGIVPLLLNEVCPESGHHLVERKGKWGRTFTGCSGYPDCKYIKKEPRKKKED